MIVHDAILKRLGELRAATPPESWQIQFRGKTIALSNGKSVWKKIGHAKSALLLDLSSLHWGVDSVAENSREVRAALRDLEARGDIVYVRVV